MIDEFGDPFGGHGAYGQSVRGAIVFPFAAHQHTEVWDGGAANLAGDTVETYVRQVMLATGIEATGHLEVQVTHGGIERATLLSLQQALMQHGGKSAGGGDAELARVRARTGHHVFNLARAT